MIAIGFLAETAERCEEMCARIISFGIIDNEHCSANQAAHTFAKHARALRAVADWIRPDAST